MNIEPYLNEATKIWAPFINSGTVNRSLQAELNFYTKLFKYSQAGPSFYYVYDFQKNELKFLGNEVEKILGWNSQSSYEFMMEKVHPEDVKTAVAFQERLVSFFTALPIDKIFKYKISFDWRVRNSDGNYLRMLQQAFVAAHDEQGMIIRLFCIQTDITHLKPEGNPTLSFMGLDGEPSYVNIGGTSAFTESEKPLSTREKQILSLLIEGKISKQVAGELNISKQTIDKHRKNMLHKNGVATIGELIGKAVKEGWV